RGGERERLALIFAFAQALAVHGYVDPVIAEDALQLRHVGEARHILENEYAIGQKRGDHQRQGGVLGARDRKRAPKRSAADDAYAIHINPRAAVPPPQPSAWRTAPGDCGES